MKALSPSGVRRTCVSIIGIVVVFAGALVASGSADGGTVTAPGTAMCEFPAVGAREVPTELAAAFPDTVAAGEQFAPRGLAVTLVVPADAITALRDTGRSTISASVDARFTVRQGESSTALAATGLSTKDTALPPSGPLEIQLTGELPPATAGPGQNVVVELAGLTPRITSGATGIACTADPDAGGELATIAVTGDAPGQPAPPPIPNAAPDCPGAVCTSLTVEGLSHVAKLGSDIILTPGQFDAVAYFDGPDPEWPLRLEGDLRLPAVDAYFVIFRFVPATSVVAFVADGKVTGKGRIVTPPGVNCDGLCVEVDLVVKLYVKLSDVKQDGIPLDVGDTCATAVPAAIPMKGVIAGIGGPGGTKSEIETTYEIPPYAGCGTAEDLDPLLTGLVSGPGNLLKNTLTTLPPETGAP